MLAAAVYLTLLPDELLLRCFEHFRLPEIPPALKAMRLTCTAWRERLNTADNLYSALAAIFDGHRSRSSGTMRIACLLYWGHCPSSEYHRDTLMLKVECLERCILLLSAGTGSNRRSLRIALSPKDALAQAFQSLVTRSETLHHMLAVMAQDNRNLTVVRARGLLSRWTPVLLDRVSAVYDVTILMEVCRARVSESVIAAVVNEMISLWGVDPNVSNSKGLSPVLIAANRGLPKVLAVLLSQGARADAPPGYGCFRLSNTRRILRGSWSPLEWTTRMIVAETENHIPPSETRSLKQCQKLLEEHLLSPPI